MTWTPVQATTETGDGFNTSHDVVFSSNVTAGNTLIMIVQQGDCTGVTDTLGNTWAPDLVDATNVWSVYRCTTASSGALTATYTTTANGSASAYLTEWPGAVTLDLSLAGATGFVTNPSLGPTSSLAQSGELILAAIRVTLGHETVTPTSPLTDLAQATVQDTDLAYLTAPDTSGITAQWASSTSNAANAVILAYKAAAVTAAQTAVYLPRSLVRKSSKWAIFRYYRPQTLTHQIVAWTPAAIETEIAADLAAVKQALLRSDTETETETDTPDRVFTGSRTVPETTTASDAPNRVQTLLRALFEAIGVTDLASRVGVLKRQDAESTAATDSAARQAGYARQDAESISDTDTANRQEGLNRQDAESSATSDSGNRLTSALRAALETVTSSDLVQRVLTLGRTSAESATATDAANRQAALTRQDVESTTASDQPNRVQQLLRAIAETVQTLDSAAASVGHGATDWVVSAAETVLASDLVQRALTLGRQTPETSTAADTPARQTDLGRATQEATGAADAAGRSVSAQRSVDDATTAQDTPGRIHGIIAAVAETLSNSDTLSHAASLLRTIAEALHVTDLVSAIIGRRYRPSGQGMVLTPLPHAMTLAALPPAELTLPAQPFALTLTPRS